MEEGLMDIYTVAWIFWLLLFVAIEGPAIFNKRKGDTLSEHVWSWFSIKQKGAGWRLRRVVLLAFMGWLVLHFMTGGWV